MLAALVFFLDAIITSHLGVSPSAPCGQQRGTLSRIAKTSCFYSHPSIKVLESRHRNNLCTGLFSAVKMLHPGRKKEVTARLRETVTTQSVSSCAYTGRSLGAEGGVRMSASQSGSEASPSQLTPATDRQETTPSKDRRSRSTYVEAVANEGTSHHG